MRSVKAKDVVMPEDFYSSVMKGTVEILGLEKTSVFLRAVLRSKKQPESLVFHRWILDKGFTTDNAERLADELDIQRAAFVALLGMSMRTFQRKQQLKERLDSIASDRVFRLARLLALASAVFNNREQARNWLHREQIGLGGVTPSDLMATEAGARQVEELLESIRYGSYV